MKTRCLNKNHKHYSYYGGRGISICEQWLIFENFYKDMGERPEGMTLDRIDSDGNYCKENCRWATRSEQVLNRSQPKIYKNKSSKYRGVYYSESINMWVALLCYDKKNKKIGRFKKEILAAIAYNNYVVFNGYPEKANDFNVLIK